MIEVFTDVYYMKQAYLEARKAYEKGEVPVGAIMVCNNQIIARTYNNTEQLTDVTAHAEIMAMTAAATYLGNKYLNDCTLFVTLEPCIMCAGALAWGQLGRLVFGASDEKSGFMRYGKELLHPKTKVEFGVLHDECSTLMTKFFKKKR
ncbi:MAG: tRNA(adenine34) deaminase [Saprospiraceae bacterium]|jgi:tRNA(adenine34) deaminase